MTRDCPDCAIREEIGVGACNRHAQWPDPGLPKRTVYSVDVPEEGSGDALRSTVLAFVVVGAVAVGFALLALLLTLVAS